MAEPAFTLAVGADRFAATARVASAEEASRLWPRAVGAMPSYVAYRKATDREIPLLVVTPAARRPSGCAAPFG